MKLRCIGCGTSYPADKIRYTCDCGNLLAVERDTFPTSTKLFDDRRASRKTIDQSGVWRFREAVLDIDDEHIVTHPEGSTRLYERNGWVLVPDERFEELAVVEVQYRLDLRRRSR